MNKILCRFLCEIGIHIDPLRKEKQRCDTVSCECGKEWYISGFKLTNPHPKKYTFHIDESRWWEQY